MNIKNIFLGISILLLGIQSCGQHSSGANNDPAIEVANCLQVPVVISREKI